MRWWIAVAVGSLCGGCLVEVDYGGTSFQCNSSDEACPDGFQCTRGSCIELSTELVVHWAFDEASGAVASDSSGNGRDGAVSGPVFEAGRFGNALRFDGLGGSVSDPEGSAYLEGLSALSLLVWVRSDVIDTNQGIVNGIFPSEGNTADARGISLRYDLEGITGGGVSSLKAGVLVEGDNVQEIEAASNTQTTEWQHLALTWESGGDLILYIDGEATVPASIDPPVVGVIDGLDAFVVGKGAKDIMTSWSGLIDDVRIYDGALTADEVRAVSGL